MPLNARCAWPGVAYHVTQRGTNRDSVFFSARDYQYYLALVSGNLAEAGVRVMGYCLMTNHVHFIVVPESGDGLSILFLRVVGAAVWTAVRAERKWRRWAFENTLLPQVWQAIRE
jgi:putative transposase